MTPQVTLWILLESNTDKIGTTNYFVAVVIGKERRMKFCTTTFFHGCCFWKIV
jgi:hypothetical protein